MSVPPPPRWAPVPPAGVPPALWISPALAPPDWNTLIVGKLSPWIRPDAKVEAVRRNSEAAMLQELNFGAYLGLPAFLLPLTQGENPNLARVLSTHIHTGHHSTMVRAGLGGAGGGRGSVRNSPLVLPPVLDAGPPAGPRGSAGRPDRERAGAGARGRFGGREDMDMVRGRRALLGEVRSPRACSWLGQAH
uniref:PRMT5 TIM barrel domain-containing protein n=1 Tax=Chelydra serpentina TaxID=8475 RepID=A0A8C3XNI3_CHESE